MDSKFRLGSLGIRGRLFLGFALLVLPILIVIFVFLIKINEIEVFSRRMVDVILPTQTITSSLDAQLYETQLAAYKWLLLQDPEEKANWQRIWDDVKQSQDEMKDLASQNDNKEFMAHWENLNALYPKLQTVQSKLLAEQLSSSNETIKQIITSETRPILSEMIDHIDGPINGMQHREGGLFDIQSDQLSQKAKIILEDIDNLRTLAYFLFCITLGLASVISFLTARKIIQPVKAYSKYSSNIAAGDLTQRLTIQNDDEMGVLGKDLNSMAESLAMITSKITEASFNMISLLEEVQHASDMQSTGVSEQASSINEITASLEEIDKSASQTMEKAKILGQIAEQTSQKGQMGLNAVEHSIEGMKSIQDKVQIIAKTILELSNQTQQIGEITTVVNTLAQQSKMLALNASIEAAKAGEAGKGFAVVAAEVKNLAEQSEQSTAQVQKILEDIRHGTEKAVIVTEEGAKGVAQGTGVVEQMGEIMRTLTEAINETMLASQQIEAAVRQESLGIEQITVGMNEINQVTSSFVNTVKETTDLISKLGVMAKSIKNSVDVYKV